MNGRDKKNEKTLTLVEAVETLSNIADLQIDQHSELKEESTSESEQPTRTLHWLHHKEASETINIVRETFCTILKYLKDFYKDNSSDISNVHTLEGIKTVMILVAEAAKKLDRCTSVFFNNKKDSVTELKEYKKLQEFYSNRISKQIDERKLGEWVFALSHKKIIFHNEEKLKTIKSVQAKHVFMDLDSAKKDTEYELFLLRKEDGTRFFSPRLIRNIKLISDFESYLSGDHEVDPLLNTGVWESRYAHHVANICVKSLKDDIERFLELNQDNRPIVQKLNKAIIALFMAAKLENVSHPSSIKDCHNYYKDFQGFIRECLQSSDYQKMIAYPPDDEFSNIILKIIRTFCTTLYSGLVWPHELTGMVQGLIHESESNLTQDSRKTVKQPNSLGNRLSREYTALAKYIKQHPNSAMNKILSLLEDSAGNVFDPLMQDNLPLMLYGIYVQDKVFPFARWPSVTVQNFINKAIPNEEFKAFLNDCIELKKKVLMINFQDRVSWKEQARCEVIEALGHHYKEVLDVVTLAKDTEFYNQLAPFTQENQAHVFMESFKKELKNSVSGYFFSDNETILEEFYEPCMDEIHKIFFSKKNVLTRENRLDFIEIFYLFLNLKLVDLLKPDVIGLSCKDGLDITSTAATELYVFMKLLSQEQFSENDREFIDSMLYCPCLLTRGRILNLERFNRMVSVLKGIESVRSQFGFDTFSKIIQQGFGRFYSQPILSGKVFNLT